MSRTFFPNGGNEPPTFKYASLSSVYKGNPDCFFCKYRASAEEEPEIQKAFTVVAQMIRETQTVPIATRAQGISKLYDQIARKYVPGQPEWTPQCIQDCLTLGHGTADANAILQFGISDLGLLYKASSDRMARINAQTGEFDGPNVPEARLGMEVLKTIHFLKS